MHIDHYSRRDAGLVSQRYARLKGLVCLFVVPCNTEAGVYTKVAQYSKQHTAQHAARQIHLITLYFKLSV
jgi:hypothetical protein